MLARRACLDEPVSPAVIRSLRDRIDLLEEENRQLREAAEALVIFPPSWRLAEMEAKLLSALMRARTGCMSHESLLTALYGLEPDVDIEIIRVWVYRVRKKLRAAAVPVEIHAVWGQGIRLSAEARMALVAALAGEDGSAAERREAETTAVIADLTARVEALQAENGRLQILASTPAHEAQPVLEKAWKRFAKARPPRRAPTLVIRGGAPWPLTSAS